MSMNKVISALSIFVIFFTIFVVLAGFSGIAEAAMYPAAKAIVLSEDSDVTVTYTGTEAAYNSLFGLSSPDKIDLGWSKSTPWGKEFNLGRFNAGTELVFYIYVSNTGYYWFSGPAARNVDGQVHAAISDIDFQTWKVGFEDLYGGGDRDFNDVRFQVKGDLYIIPPAPEKPDFIILSGDITFSNTNPSEGDVIEIQAIVRNFGKSTDSDVAVGFYDGDPDTGGNLIFITTLSGLGKEENKTTTIQWDTTGKAGAHNIYVKVDPENVIEEVHEDNNKAYGEIFVATSPTSPVADFTATPTEGTVPLTVLFTDTSTGDPTAWEWDVDNDGNVDYTTQDATHNYTDPGVYTVSLMVSNEYGSDTKTKADYITVTPSVAATVTIFKVDEGIKYPGDIVKIYAEICNNGDIDYTFNVEIAIRDSNGLYHIMYDEDQFITSGECIVLNDPFDVSKSSIPIDIAEGACNARLVVSEPNKPSTYYDIKWVLDAFELKSVPDEWKHDADPRFFHHQALTGDIGVIVVFVEGQDQQGKWTDSERSNFWQRVADSWHWIADQSIDMPNPEPQFTTRIFGCAHNGEIVETAGAAEPVVVSYNIATKDNCLHKWDQEAPYNLGFRNTHMDNVGRLIYTVKSKYNLDTAIILYAVPEMSGEGITGIDGDKLRVKGGPWSVVYMHTPPIIDPKHVITHEALHCFGATDQYDFSEITNVMFFNNMPGSFFIDDLTKTEIGWKSEELGLIGGRIYKDDKSYLFSWDDVPGNDNEKLIDFLKLKFGIEWIGTAKIEKIDDSKTIKISTEKNYLSLQLNDEKSEVRLKIDDGRTYEFIAKMENGKLNIYDKPTLNTFRLRLYEPPYLSPIKEEWVDLSGGRYKLAIEPENNYFLKIWAIGYGVSELIPISVNEPVGTENRIENMKIIDIILEKTKSITVENLCPTDLFIKDPDGLIIDKDTSNIPDALYVEIDSNNDGDLDDIVFIPYKKLGDYTITVIPELDAEPTDTYSLKVSSDDTTIVLAENVPIGDIPDQPYIIRVTEEGIFQVISPVADANGPYKGFVGEPISFDGTGSYDPDGTIVSYEWDFDDDGEYDDATGATPTMTWYTPYTGAISLKITDNHGATDINSTSLTVIIPATVDFDPDTLNKKSEGNWVTTYIELPEGYDVSNIDLSTVMLNAQVHAQPAPTGIGDCDSDGISDLMVKFDRSTVHEILEVGDEVEVTVTGELTDGTPFEGSDTIRVIEKGGKK